MKPRLDGLRITSSGVAGQQREQLQLAIEQSGGIYQSTLNTNTQLLVCQQSDSTKFWMAVTQLQIPVVSLQAFIAGTSASGGDIAGMMQMHGLSVCVTRLSQQQREEVRRECVKMGAHFNVNLTAQCTHLLLPNTITTTTADLQARSEKHKFAVENGIKCVDMQWFHRMQSLEIKAFSTTATATTTIAASGIFGGLTFAFSRGFTRQQLKAFTELVMSCGGAVVVDDQQKADYLVATSNPTLTPTTVHLNVVNEQFLRQCCKKQRLLNSLDYQPSPASVGQPDSVELVASRHQQQKQQQHEDEVKEAVVLKKSRASQSQSLRELSQMFGYDPVTRSQVSETLPPPAMSGKQVAVSSSFKDITKALASTQSQSVAVAIQTPSTMSQSLSTSDTVHQQQYQQQQSSLSSSSSSSLSCADKSQQVFNKLTFKIAASVDTAKSKALARAITSNGGTVTHANDVDYTVQLFGRGDQECVTEYWIEACIDVRRVIDVAEFVAYRPTVHELPLPHMHAVRVSLSGYDNQLKRAQMTRAFQSMGATVTQSFSRTENNLLLVESLGDNTSAKLIKAQQWQVPVVVGEQWLRECLTHGQPPRPFQLAQKPQAAESFKFDSAFDTTDAENVVMASLEQVDAFKSEIQQPSTSQQFTDSDKILHGVILCCSTRLSSRQQHEVSALCGVLGAQYIGTGCKEVCTHYVHESSRVNEQFADFKLAKSRHKFIVSPQWLRACRDSGVRIAECKYPHTYSKLSTTADDFVTSGNRPQVRALSFEVVATSSRSQDLPQSVTRSPAQRPTQSQPAAASQPTLLKLDTLFGEYADDTQQENCDQMPQLDAMPSQMPLYNNKRQLHSDDDDESPHISSSSKVQRLQHDSQSGVRYGDPAEQVEHRQRILSMLKQSKLQQ